jgi:hypothetical protein
MVIRSAILLSKEVIIRPRCLFERLRHVGCPGELSVVLALAAVVTLVKSFADKATPPYNFFENKSLERVVVVMSSPQIHWLLGWALYPVFLFAVFRLCKVFNRTARFSSVSQALIAVNAVGLAAQVVFFPLRYMLSPQVLLVLYLILFFWVSVLDVLGVKTTAAISTRKAVVAFIIPAIILTLAIGSPTVCPAIAWVAY